VIAGNVLLDEKAIAGPIQGLSTAPVFLDVHLPAGASFNQLIAEGHNAFIYPYEGKVLIGAKDEQRLLELQFAGILSDGECIEVSAGVESTAFLLLAARPLLEPIVQYGPFVMNTREEIEQTIADYQNGNLV
jgi:redox-sensitive bicupin YhaK (pirin superfamily)